MVTHQTDARFGRIWLLIPHVSYTFLVQLGICRVGKTSVKKSLIFKTFDHQKAEDADTGKRGSEVSTDSPLFVSVNKVAMEEHQTDAGFDKVWLLTPYVSYTFLVLSVSAGGDKEATDEGRTSPELTEVRLLTSPGSQ